MELHGRDRPPPVLQRHDDAVVRLRGHREEIGGQSVPHGVERVVAPDPEAPRQPVEQRPPQHRHLGRLAVDGRVETVETAAEIFGDGLEPETDAEQRHSAREESLHGQGGVEIAGTARPWRQHGQIRRVVLEGPQRRRGAQGLDRRSRLPQVVREGVDEGILVVDQQHAAPVAGPGRANAAMRGRRLRPQRREQRRRLETAFVVLRLRVAVVEQRRAGADFGDPLLHADGPQGEPGVHPAVEADAADGAAVPAARRALVLLDEADRPLLRRARHRHRPGVAQEGVERVELGPQDALHVVHRVDQPGIELHLAAPDHPHRARLADARLVVAVDVGAHRELGLVLGRIDELRDLGGVAQGVLAAGDGAGDRAGFDSPALDPDVHLRRGGDQELAASQVHQRTIGCRVAGAQALEHRGRRVRAGFGEELAQHHLEQVAPAKRLLGASDRARIGTRPMVVAARHAAGAPALVRVRRGGAGDAPRVPGGTDEIVAMAHRPPRHVVDDQDLVGQEEHQIALVGRAREGAFDRLELVCEVVAEGAVKPEMLIPVAPEQIDDGAQQAEDRGLPAAPLLGHGFRRRADRAGDARRVRLQALDRVQRREGGADGLQQEPPPFAQRRD